MWSLNHFLLQSDSSCNRPFIGWNDYSYTKTHWSDLLVRPTAVTTATQPSNQISLTGHVIPCGAGLYKKIRRLSRWALFDKSFIVATIHNLTLLQYKSWFVVSHLSTCRLREGSCKTSDSSYYPADATRRDGAMRERLVKDMYICERLCTSAGLVESLWTRIW